MTKYKVRERFTVWLTRENSGKRIKQNYSSGEIIDLTEDEYKLVKHQVEAVPTAKNTKTTKEVES